MKFSTKGEISSSDREFILKTFSLVLMILGFVFGLIGCFMYIDEVYYFDNVLGDKYIWYYGVSIMCIFFGVKNYK